jgi:hypothetical protein
MGNLFRELMTATSTLLAFVRLAMAAITWTALLARMCRSRSLMRWPNSALKPAFCRPATASIRAVWSTQVRNQAPINGMATSSNSFEMAAKTL